MIFSEIKENGKKCTYKWNTHKNLHESPISYCNWLLQPNCILFIIINTFMAQCKNSAFPIQDINIFSNNTFRSAKVTYYRALQVSFRLFYTIISVYTTCKSAVHYMEIKRNFLHNNIPWLYGKALRITISKNLN